MGSIILSMLFVVLVGTFVIGAVAVGMRGKGKQQHPKVADAFARAAMALNGEAEVPASLQRAFR
ncbi:hypothetical protein GCM10027418_03920 [Mariniluteicoccus endophyticus]